MIVVFWRETDPTDGWIRSEMVEFRSDEMGYALKFMEALRKMRRDGTKQISHVCMQSEMPEAVGEPGVSAAGKDYEWYKRRIDPKIKLGRSKTDECTICHGTGANPNFPLANCECWPGMKTGDDIEVDLSGE